jgi:TetR/AcrR family transcriptional repressor of nem operon
VENSLSKAERTRAFIIETTAEIFNRKGYAGTSMSDLTDATGLSKGSIYGNFENKEEVALAVFDFNAAKISTQVRTRIDAALSYHDKLLVYSKVYRSMLKGVLSAGGCPILNTATEADDTNNQLKDRAAKAVLKWEKNLCDLMEKGIQAGELRKDIAVRQTALSVIALIEGGLMISKVTNDPTAMDKVLKTVESIIESLQAVQ